MSFPDEEARKVKLVVPEEWKSGSTSCHLELKNGLLHVISDDNYGQTMDVIDPEDMIGASLVTEPKNMLTLFCYPRLNPTSQSFLARRGVTAYKPAPNPNYIRPDPNCKWQRVAHPRSFVLQSADDLAGAKALLTALQQLAGPQEALRYLVVVNPFSGPKQNGSVICETIVKPMLEQAGIDVDVVITTHGGHASELMAKTADNKDLSKYQGLVLMGGDGIVFEALNGIMKRDDVDAIRKSLKLGVVGCGTSNGFVASVAHASDELYGPLTEAFLICKGKTTLVDTSRYQTAAAPDKSYTSFLTYAYGMIADIDIESETARWLGETRNDVWAVMRILTLRKYPARLSYLPADQVPDRKTKGTAMPATLTEPVPKDWKVIEDDIVLFWASHVTHAAMHTHQAPNAKFNDGVFRLFLIRGNISRYRLALILLGMETGSHVGMKGAEFIDCCAFRLEPKEGEKVGRNVVDGELVERGPIQGCVLPGMFSFFCKPQQDA